MLTHAFVRFIFYSSHFTSLSMRLECTFSVRSNILLKNGGFVYCSQDLQVLFFSKNNFKIGFHGIIHTFKNYFATVFSILSFQQNKLYPNGPKQKGMEWVGKNTHFSLLSWNLKFSFPLSSSPKIGRNERE